jgi:acyl homoserine lactone synthase
MLEIVQAGQAGKTGFLLDMHRLRKRVFHDRMGWDVHVSPGGLEVDDFDTPETVYLLCLNEYGRVIGNWRLLPTTGPYMIRDVWPEFLQSIDIREASDAWEASRFAVDSLMETSAESLAMINAATQEMLCGLTELCVLAGIREIYTMYDRRIARLLKRLDCLPATVSRQLTISGAVSEVGRFITDGAMLSRLRAATGISRNLITKAQLPPLLQRPSRISDWERKGESRAEEGGAA